METALLQCMAGSVKEMKLMNFKFLESKGQWGLSLLKPFKGDF